MLVDGRISVGLGGGMVYARVSKTRGCNDLESSSLSPGTFKGHLQGQSLKGNGCVWWGRQNRAII